MQRLVKYIGAILLMALVTMMASKQKDTTWQEAVPHEYTLHYSLTEKPASERTFADLCHEQLAIPANITGEVPGYQPYHSKPKCLHSIDRAKRHDTCSVFMSILAQYRSPIHHHVIDYYIYTLEHILN